MNHNWEYKKFEDVLKIINGRNQKNVENPNGQYPIYGSGGIMSRADSFLCPENCTIIGRKGNINNPIFVPTKFWNVDTAFGLCPNPKFILPKFLFYFCIDYNFLIHNKATTIPSLVKSDLLKISIPVPGLDVQDRIVTELDEINALIEKNKKLIETLNLLAQSLFFDMFGDPIANPKDWEVKKIKESGIVVTGSTPSTKDSKNYQPAAVCFVKPGDISDNNITYISSTTDYISHLAFDTLCRKLPEGAVVITCIGTIGKVGILQVEAATNQQINAIIPNSNNNNIYLAYTLKSFQKIFVEAANGPVVKIINKTSFSDISIPVPPLGLQEEFARRVEEIEAEKGRIEVLIGELQTLLDSRMDYWFN